MNKQEILEEIAKIKERLSDLEKMYSSLNPPTKRWRAEKYDPYFFVGTDCSVCRGVEDEVRNVNDGRYKIGNYFERRKQAEFEAERLKVVAELKAWATPISEFDWNDDAQKKYVIILENNLLRADFFYSLQICDLYFESKEIAERAIESVGEDRIKKYYFRRGEE